MSTFIYKAHNEEGAIVRGSIEASSTALAAAELDKMGFLPVSISEKKKSNLEELNLKLIRIKTDDLIFFTRQLRTIIKSGVPLLRGLKSLEQQTENNRLKTIISSLIKDVDRGKSFSGALSNHPAIFPEVYISTVDAGEKGGVLDEVLERLIRSLEFNKKTTDTLKAAMRYPLFVIIAFSISFTIIVTKLIPQFVKVFESAKVTLPLPTRIMIQVNSVVQNYWYCVLSGLILTTIAFVTFINTEIGRLYWDHFKIKIPILGPVFLKIYMARFSSTFETLIRSGISIDVALPIVARTIGNEYVALKVKEGLGKIEKGGGIAGSLKESEIFTPLLIQMISTGEEAGALDDMLKEVTEHYEREIDYTVSKLSAYLEPILLVGMVILVGWMAMAVFYPMWDMLNVAKGVGG